MNKRNLSETSPEINQNNKKVQKMSSEQMNEVLAKLDTVLLNQSENTKLLKTAFEKITRLESEVDRINAAVNNIEQDALTKSFSIVGLPPIEQRDVNILTEKFFSRAGIKISSATDFKNLFVINQRTGSRIMGSFYCEKTRDEVVKKLKVYTKATPILAEHLILNLKEASNKNGKDFVGKEVRYFTKTTEYTRTLLRQAKVHLDKFKFVWERDGRVMMKKDENSKIIRVRSIADIIKYTTV